MRPQEYERWKAAARRSGLTFSEWARRALDAGNAPLGVPSRMEGYSLPIGFNALPDQIEAWHAKARAANLLFKQWAADRLNAAADTGAENGR